MPASPLQIRLIEPGELDAVADLTVAVYRAEGLCYDEYEPSLRDVRSRASTATVLVAVQDGRVVGAVTVATRLGPWAEQAVPGEAVIRMLVVDPPARGSGVGAALMRACEHAARAAGCRLVRLSSHDGSRSHRLYEQLGFRRVPALDWSAREGVVLRAFALPLVPWCGHCGRELTSEGHASCRAAASHEPPRYCGRCRRRLVVQVMPTGWVARCVEHGSTAG